MANSLSRKMVSRRPAGPTRPASNPASWILCLAAAPLLATTAFFLSSALLRSFATPAAAHSTVDSQTGALPIITSPLQELPERNLASSLAHSSPEEDAELRPSPSDVETDTSSVQILRSQSQGGLNYRFTAEQDPLVSTTGLAPSPASISDLEFLEADVSGQEFYWNGSSRRVLYYIGNSQLEIALTLDLPASAPFSSLLSDENSLSGPGSSQSAPDENRATLQISLPGSAASDTATAVVHLPMAQDYHSQVYETHLPNACGPAAALIVLDYYGLEDSLHEVIDLMRQVAPQQGGYDPACQQNPVCTSPETIAKLLSDYYGLIVQTRSEWSLEDVHQALQRGNPVIADIRWFQQGGTLGHFVVIYGVDPHARTLTYHDPFTGADRTSTWEHFSTRWSGPVDVADPLQPDGFRFWGMEIYPPPAS